MATVTPYNEFKNTFVNNVAAEYNCSFNDAFECYGDSELQLKWRCLLMALPKNTMPIEIAKNFISIFGYENFTRTFRGVHEQVFETKLA